MRRVESKEFREVDLRGLKWSDATFLLCNCNLLLSATCKICGDLCCSADLLKGVSAVGECCG